MSQISMERLFSVSGLLTANRRNRLEIEHLDDIVRINRRDELFQRRAGDVEKNLDEETTLAAEMDEETDF